MTLQIDQTLIPAGVPEKETLATEAQKTVEIVDSINIDSDFMYSLAGEELTKIKGQIKALNDKRLEITRPMDAAKKAVMDLFKPPLATLEKAESKLKGAMITYQRAEEAKRLEAQREAEKAAEAERQRLREEAEKATEKGDFATAITHAATADMVTAAPVENEEAPKAAGVSTTKRWKAEIEDKAAFLKHALENEEFLDMVEINMKPLNQMAVAMKDKLKIPGVKAVSELGLSVRA